MAGDWIKMRTHLDTAPRVLQLADLVGVHPLYVVGMLWKLWAWADAHSLDGNTLGVTDVTLDGFVDRPGFAAALRKVGWLEGRDGALTFPRFAEHNGQTAKKRAETKERVARHRQGNGNADVTTKVLPEKRREEKREKNKHKRQKVFSPPSLEEVRAHCAERKSLIDPEAFHAHYTANGWVQGSKGKPIRDWRACVVTWERNEARRTSEKSGLYNGLVEFVARGGEA